MCIRDRFETERRFERFVDEINDKVCEIFGMSVDDFPDFDFYSVYEEGIEPDSKEWNDKVRETMKDYIVEVANF